MHHIDKCTEEQEACKASRTHSKTFGHCLRCIASSVKSIHYVTGSFGLFTHLHNASCVVCDRPENIHCKHISEVREHAHGGNSCAKEASSFFVVITFETCVVAKVVRSEYTTANDGHGRECGLHANPK